MKAGEFRAAAIAFLGSDVGWRQAIRSRLGVNRRTFGRWMADGWTPAWADAKLEEMTGGDGGAAWPRDEWMIGNALNAQKDLREYIVHLIRPRFVGRIVALDRAGNPLPKEQPVDIDSIALNSRGDYVICEIDWIDAASSDEKLTLLHIAANEIDQMEERLDDWD